MLKTYKIRNFKNGQNKDGKPFMNYSITVPANIAEVLPEDVQFSVELTEDGLLFRRAEVSESTVQVPSWAQKQSEDTNGASAPAKPAARKAAPKATGTKAPARKRPAPKAKPAEAAPATEVKTEAKAQAKAPRKRPAAPKAKADAPAKKPATGARKRPGAKTAA